MSKHMQHHTNVMHDVLSMSSEELQDLYGIEIQEDGVVWDPLEGKSFETVHLWAAYTEALTQEDDEEYVFKKISNSRYDDDY